MSHRILQDTIWETGAIPLEEWKYRNLKRIALPVYDGFVIIAGIAGYVYGVPAIRLFYDQGMGNILSLVFGLMGMACLAGVSFPHLWKLEIFAKSGMLGFHLAYLSALLFLVADGDPNRALISIIVCMSMVMPVWRLSILGSERRERLEEKKLLEEKAKQ